MATLTAQEQQELAYEDNTPTPAGWRRKLIPHIGKGLIPAKTDVVFVAPSGEEFKSKAQLQRYLKVNKGSPSVSEFIWSTDEIPRRSSRPASKRSKSPPKTISKKKPAAEVPHEEAKATKRSRPEKESVVEEASSEDKKRLNKKASKAIPSERKEDINGKASPKKDINGDLTSVAPTRKAKDEKKKPMKDTKKKKRGKAEAKSNKGSSTMTETSPIAQKSEKEHENWKEELNGKEETMEENGKEEEPNSLEEMDETQKMQTEVQEGNEAKDLNDDMENEGGEKDDRTTTSLLGSDLSAEGMEADSDVFESEEGRASHEEEEEETNTAPQ